jgi:uncharacterized membrane protein
MKWNLKLANTSLYDVDAGNSGNFYEAKTAYKFRHQAYEKLHTDTKYIRIIARVSSPLIIMILFLMFLFPYMITTGTGNIESTWVKILLFPFSVINLLLADFVLWNWFEGKNVAKIWLIELSIAFTVLYMLIC